MSKRDTQIETLAVREQYRDWYLQHRDPIADDRMLWRAQSFRHMMHIVPGQTILELGCGTGLFTRQVLHVTRGENQILSVTFSKEQSHICSGSPMVELMYAKELPGPLENKNFDFIVAQDLLDRRNCSWILEQVYSLLKPGGQVLFYESNPWNIVLKLRQALGKLMGRGDPRYLLNRPELYELMSEMSFIRVFSIYNDFVYAPLTPRLVSILRNLSIVLENAPGVRTLAGSILVHAQKPPRRVEPPKASLFVHERLRKKVSVVIPCHNEERNIGPLVTRLRDLFGEYIHEIIPIDDNSIDQTREVIRKLAEEDPRVKPIFRSPPNGVGRALSDGYQMVTGQYVLSMDCDFQHLLPEIRDLFDAASEGYDVIAGSRFSRHSVLLNYPFNKILANRSFHLLAHLVFFRHFRDLTNNLKLLRREVVESLQLQEPGFAVNAEVGFQPLLMGFTFKEVPISWINRTFDMGMSSFRLAGFGGGYGKVLWHLFLKRYFGRGSYKDLPIRKKGDDGKKGE